MTRTLRLLLALLAAVSCSLAAKAPLTHEAMWLMKRVGAPIASPDGRWVVFSVVEPAYDEKDQVSDLWIAPTDGRAPRRLTFSSNAETGAAWSPDSRRLAFSARRERDEADQIYVLDVAGGGEAARVTSLSTGATSPRWRPDGKALLFSSSVYRGATDDDANKKIAAERKSRKYNARVYEGFPVRYWDRWLEDTQTRLFVQSLEPGAKARDLLAGTKLAAEPGFAGSPTLTGEDLGAVWAPDGQSVVFVATTKRNTAAHAFYATHLYQAPASLSEAGGEPKPLTSGEASYSRPVFRPDGKALYCRYEPQTDKVYNLERVARFAWPAMANTSAEALAGCRPAPCAGAVHFDRRPRPLGEQFCPQP